MASLHEYLEKLDSEQLENILVREMYGWDHYPLSSIYLMCTILSEREPQRGTARDIFLEFARQYAENQRLCDW